MIQHKYALPRHTNLAKQGARTGAFLIDIAISLALTLGFVFAVFKPIFKGKTEPCWNLVYEEQLNSNLYIINDDGNQVKLSGSDSNETFLNTLKYYYLCYLPGENIAEGKTACKEQRNVTVEWFNVNILEVNNDETLFTLVDNDINQIAIKKDNVTEVEISQFLQGKYRSAIINDFNNISYIKDAGRTGMVFNTLSYVLAIFISGAITYIVLPFILKNGQTAGKKAFKIALANSNGYSFENKQLFMRFVPFFVVDASLMFLINANLYLVLLIILIIFMVSFCLAMSSPKRMSLHDLCAQTIVIDFETSIIFKNEIDESKYLLQEENTPIEPIDENGEEPEISYER